MSGLEGARNGWRYQSVQILKDKPLGTGSYGCVCRARLDQLICAAKVLHPVLFNMQEPDTRRRLEMFRSECELLSRLRHPNIIQYIGTAPDPESNLPVLFMELLDYNLTHFLEDHLTGPLSYHLLINFSHDIASAVAYLHSNTIIHRDLSSNNVLLLAGVRAKVTDLGMSKLTDHRASAQTLCPGSAVYMPPEAMSEPAEYGPKLDIFSIGVLFIQMMTRSFPSPTKAIRRIDTPHEIPVLIPVPEIERRKNHVDLIPHTHSLLPITMECLQDQSRKRPNADRLWEKLETLKSGAVYKESMQIEDYTRQAVQQQSSEKDSLQQINERLAGQLKEKEFENQVERERAELQMMGLTHELQEARRVTANTQKALEQERRRRESLQAQVQGYPKLQSGQGPPGHTTRQPSSHKQQLQPNSDVQYVAVLYTPSCIENFKREWNAVFALCPKCSTGISTGLRQLVTDMFDESFTSSSVCVTFDYSNTLTLGIPEDFNTREYDISFSVIPPTIERDEVDPPHQDGEQPPADDVYPPRIILTIRPSPLRPTTNRLDCTLSLEGVQARRCLILATPTVMKPKHGTVLSHHYRQQPHMGLLAQPPLRLDQDGIGQSDSRSIQHVFTGTIQPHHYRELLQSKNATIKPSVENEHLLDSEMEHPALDKCADLAALMNLVGSQIPLTWHAIGLQLGLKQCQLDLIKPISVLNVLQATTEMFDTWKKNDENPSWRKLLRALRSQHVGEQMLAYIIQKHLTETKEPKHK